MGQISSVAPLTPSGKHLGYYLVLFLDVLGQREKLRKLTDLPTSEEERKRVGATLRDTVGTVNILRDCFTTYFRGFERKVEFGKGLSEEQRRTLHGMRRLEVRHYGFSDSIIVFVPLKNTNEHCTPMNGVYCSILAACSVMTLALTDGIPFRGGVDVGLGIEMTKSEIYGPALERAHFLESCKARYPRIAVGDELLNYLRIVHGQSPSTVFGRSAVILAGACLSAIFQDSDGCFALDYFGSTFQEHVAKNALRPEFVRKALDFADGERKKWTAAGNNELADRYGRLLAYLRSRSQIWGIADARSAT